MMSPLSHNVCFCPRLSGGCLETSYHFAPPDCKMHVEGIVKCKQQISADLAFWLMSE